jgi:hypothetical protein
MIKFSLRVVRERKNRPNGLGSPKKQAPIPGNFRKTKGYFHGAAWNVGDSIVCHGKP